MRRLVRKSGADVIVRISPARDRRERGGDIHGKTLGFTAVLGRPHQARKRGGRSVPVAKYDAREHSIMHIFREIHGCAVAPPENKSAMFFACMQ